MKQTGWFQVYVKSNGSIAAQVKGKKEAEKALKELKSQYPDIEFSIRPIVIK